MTTASLLPREKSEIRSGLDGKKILVYGPVKVGKTTMAAKLSDRALFLATDPGQDALEVFRVPIGSWQEFLNVGKELANQPKDVEPFEWVVVDTIDTLARLCRDHVMTGLAQTDGLSTSKFIHPSDFDYGRGWDAIAEEFRLRIARLCSLGMGVVFISHVKESTQKTRTGLEITKLAPDVGQKGMRQWLLGFVDVIAFASIVQTPEGEQRVLQLQPTETAEAGARVPEGVELPASVPLDAGAFRRVFSEAWAS